ncbi:hypothetical protein [Pseudomonas rhodesiae]|uniref:hypothetical protein n=1 Tax=Pseudomonas rhodesiae TaxID=76760 RepID=UPI0028997048|nr:hypothetical protein [Pseudomonas rhodesiae]
MAGWTLPEFSSVADALSVVGFAVTCWVAWQAKNIRRYFFNRVRIGEILPELTKEADELLLALKAWESTNGTGRETYIVLARLKGRLLNLKHKVVADEKKTLVSLLAKIEKKKFYVVAGKITDITQDDAWEIATDYAGMISQVAGGHKDSSWRQQ